MDPCAALARQACRADRRGVRLSAHDPGGFLTAYSADFPAVIGLSCLLFVGVALLRAVFVYFR